MFKSIGFKAVLRKQGGELSEERMFSEGRGRGIYSHPPPVAVGDSVYTTTSTCYFLKPLDAAVFS